MTLDKDHKNLNRSWEKAELLFKLQSNIWDAQSVFASTAKSWDFSDSLNHITLHITDLSCVEKVFCSL